MTKKDLTVPRDLIDLKAITRLYGKQSFPALQGVSFKIDRGDFVDIMGPSGCGKSTLLNILGLLDHPTSGRYHLEGKDVAHQSDLERTLLRRSTIGMVFQAFNLLPRFTAAENVCLPMAYSGVPRDEQMERSQTLLKRVGLECKGNNTPLELSGGEKQRVGIARALSNHPAILLADEPTGNLDSGSSKEILKLFTDLHQEGMTIILVTHDSNIAASAERIILIKDGKLESIR